jgi:ketosteroid isomerase-like protein
MKITSLVCVGLAMVAGCASTPPARGPDVSMPVCPRAMPNEDHAAVINRFYASFARHDFQGMACCYHHDIEFTDSIFGTLHGKRALAMWAMLVSRPNSTLKLQWSKVEVQGDHATAHWDAQYEFPFLMSDNHVDNSIDATFEFKDGKIWKHRDRFDLDRWMHMALSPLGGVVSEGTIKGAVQKKLEEFIAEHPEYQSAVR